jgi:ABC-type uncharacterized transport system involved in gliding motility auxiliary subunit
LGITGILATAIGGVLLDTVFPIAHWTLEILRSAGDGAHGPFAQYAAWTLAVGVVAVAIAVLVELLGGLTLVTGRRTAANVLATVSTVAAVALLVIVNTYSFTHHARYDLTRDERYTLPPQLVERFSKLRSATPTTIVVLQMHKTFGTLTDKRDSYTSEAERVVTEKVKDLVDLFREFGPRFNVVVLDTEAFGFDQALTNLTKDAPELRAAIDSAPENSIFFQANKRVQRLSFNEFLQLDKTASKEAEGKRGNLVLLPQGVETFARRILAVQERRPKVAVCVVHPALGTDLDVGRELYGSAGLKKALEDYGFDVIDIVLKKNWKDETKELEPAAQTARESRLEQVEAELATAVDKGRSARADRQILDVLVEEVEKLKTRGAREREKFYGDLNRGAREQQWLEVVAAYRKLIATGQGLTTESEAAFQIALLAALSEQKKRAEEQIAEADKERVAAEALVKTALADDRSTEDRRLPDVKQKLERLLGEVDLLILPRVTVISAPSGSGVPPALHAINKDQTEAIKDFMKAGKPVLACLGPLSSVNGPRAEAMDGIEGLLAERGIELGKETILFDAESRAFANLRSGAELGGAGMSEIPALTIVDRSPKLADKVANPIGSALRLTGRVVDQKLDLRFRALRPVYLATGWQDSLPFAAEFALTVPESWNEEKPFPQVDQRGRITYLPRYDPTPANDPKRNTRAAERRGPFPVGVAIESKIPAYWIDNSYTNNECTAALMTPLDGVMSAMLRVVAHKLERPTQRLVVFGSGSLFTGAKLDPAQEKLLLHSVNWLTGREDRLPRADQSIWSFPRVEMSEREITLWQLGTAIGLPLLVIYFGLLAMMFRRLR